MSPVRWAALAGVLVQSAPESLNRLPKVFSTVFALHAAVTEVDEYNAKKGYDTDAIRRQVEANGTAPNIPPKANRVWKPCFSPVLYRGRNPIERMFGRLRDFRRVATRYDRLATNFLAAVCLTATVSYWL